MSDFEKKSCGIINVVLNEIEFKATPSGKMFAKLKLERNGIEFRATCFVKAAVELLEACVEGEELSVFGAVESRSFNDKTYTEFKVLKVYPEIRDENGIFVDGIVTGTGATKYAKFIDVDVTQNPEYPAFVRIEFPKDYDGTEYEEGDAVMDVRIEVAGKFGTWTVKNKRKKAAPAPEPKGKGKKEAPKGGKSAKKDSADEGAEAPLPAGGGSDDDMPW